MIDVLIQMTALIALGAVWRHLRPLGLEADATRRAVTGVVYVLFLPALVLAVLWTAPLGLDALRTAVTAAVGVAGGMLLGWGASRATGLDRAATGAMILACGYPNTTYLGLPVLEATFGPWARGVAIQYDLFACTPLLLTVGILIARSHGEGEFEPPLKALLSVPPLWAAILGVGLNLAGVTCPVWLHGLLALMAAGVVPLMLFSLGLGLAFGALSARRLPRLAPVAVIQLALVPLLVWGVGKAVGLHGQSLSAVVLEGAMPSMVLGVVICDRFRLDTGLYAAAVALTTALSVGTLPLWFAALGGAG
ncbi:MAG: AEC family transporter [Nitrospirota bacterium]|nr:AEC family transporter [Nitrospirota bacterium]